MKTNKVNVRKYYSTSYKDFNDLLYLHTGKDLPNLASGDSVQFGNFDSLKMVFMNKYYHKI